MIFKYSKGFFITLSIAIILLIAYEYGRSALLFIFIRLFLDTKNYTYLALLIETQFILFLLVVGVFPDIYVFTHGLERIGFRLFIKRFIVNYGSYLLLLSPLFLMGVLLAFFIPQEFVGGRPLGFIVDYTLYVVLMYFYGLILLLIHYGVSPYMYRRDKERSRIVLGYLKSIVNLLRGIKHYLLYVILGSLAALLLSFIVFNILSSIFYGYLSSKLYVDPYIYKYIRTRPALIRYTEKYTSTTGSIVMDTLYFTIYMIFYRRYIKLLIPFNR